MTDYGNPDTGDNPEAPEQPHLAEVDAIVRALHTAKGTVDAKAAHIRDHLAADGWHLLFSLDGPPVQLGPGEQVHGPALDGHHWAQVPDFTTTNDDELDTLADLVARLEGLAPDARERVAVYLTDRYGPERPGPLPWLSLTPGQRKHIVESGQA